VTLPRIVESIGWAQVQQVFDSLPVRVALQDREYRFLYVNTESSRFHGKPEDTVLGATVAEVHGQELFATLRPWADRALAGEAGEWDVGSNFARAGVTFGVRLRRCATRAALWKHILFSPVM
jgi:PAS domain S-box-containing protein